MNLFTAWVMIGVVATLSVLALVIPSREDREILAAIAVNLAFVTILLAILL